MDEYFSLKRIQLVKRPPHWIWMLVTFKAIKHSDTCPSHHQETCSLFVVPDVFTADENFLIAVKRMGRYKWFVPNPITKQEILVLSSKRTTKLLHL